MLILALMNPSGAGKLSGDTALFRKAHLQSFLSGGGSTRALYRAPDLVSGIVLTKLQC
jgi:hypothetical protein